MRARAFYKNQVNRMCDVYIKVSADDILNKFNEMQEEGQKNSQYEIFDEVTVKNPGFEIFDLSEREDEKDKEKKAISAEEEQTAKRELAIAKAVVDNDNYGARIKRFRPLIISAAGVLAVTVLTIAAVCNKEGIENFIQARFKNNNDTGISKQEYLYITEQSVNGNGCTVTFEGVSGNPESPLIMCDVAFDQKDCSKMGGEIEVLGIAYDKKLSSIGKEVAWALTGTGVQDINNKGLYHISFEVPKVFIENGNTIIADISEVQYTEVMERRITPNIRLEMTVPSECFTEEDTAIGLEISDGTYKYFLKKSKYKTGETVLVYEYDKLYNTPTVKSENKFKKSYKKLLQEAYLEANGQKYECVSISEEVCEDNPNKGLIIVEYDPIKPDYGTEVYYCLEGNKVKIRKSDRMLSNEEYETEKLKICERMAEDGYTYEAAKCVYDENYKVTLVRVYGDNDNPYFQLDVEVSDVNQALINDKIGLKYRVVNAGDYDNRDFYGVGYAIGSRDEEKPNVYHMFVRAGAQNAGNNISSMVDIISVVTDVDSEIPVNNEVNMNSIYVKTPDYSLKNPAIVKMTIENIQIDKTDYKFVVEEDGRERTTCTVEFKIPEIYEESLDTIKEEYCQVQAWNFANKVAFIADGEEYRILPVANKEFKICKTGELTYKAEIEYEPMNYYMRDEVSLKIDDDVFALKAPFYGIE